MRRIPIIAGDKQEKYNIDPAKAIVVPSEKLSEKLFNLPEEIFFKALNEHTYIRVLESEKTKDTKIETETKFWLDVIEGCNLQNIPRLEKKDLHVLAACLAEQAKGNAVTTAGIIWRNMGCNGEPKSKNVEEILQSIDKMMSLKIRIDATESAEQLQQIKDDRFKKIIIDTILPCRYEVFVLNGSPHTFGIKFHAESPVFLYALAKRQITVIPSAVLNVPKTKNTQFFRELKMYINIRIDKIKRARENPKTKNFPRVIKLETLYSKCLIPVANNDRKQKKRIRDDIALYMDYLVDQGVITGFQFVDDNDKPRKNLKDCTKITFTYDDALPRFTLNWLTDK